MISISGTYVLILMILVLILFGFHLMRECQKILRQHREDAQQRTQAIQNPIDRADVRGIEQQLLQQHRENDWARKTINQHGWDKTVNPSAREKWKFLIFMMALALYAFSLFYYPTYIKNRAIKLAQNPTNILQTCMYYGGKSKLKEIRYFFIEEKTHGVYTISIEQFPAYKKLFDTYFEKNRCYKIKYIKIKTPFYGIPIPSVHKERIYVYDIDL